jgi:hypothetical protein
MPCVVSLNSVRERRGTDRQIDRRGRQAGRKGRKEGDKEREAESRTW